METGGEAVHGTKDRKIGLIVFGAGLIVLGLLCLLLALFTVAAGVLSSGVPAAGAPAKGTLAAGLAVYAGLAIFFIWMGVGSMMGRRWARALILAFSAYWLVAGGLATLVVAFIVPRLMALAMAMRGGPMSGPGPGASIFVGTLIVVAFTVLFLVLVPAALVLFYRSPHVKATCERLDPKERWTDRVPISVLALALILVAAGLRLALLVAFPAFPVFGYPLRGMLATAAIVAMAVALWVLAVNVYRRRRWAWTATLALTLVVFASGFVTLVRMSPESMLELYSAGPALQGMGDLLNAMMPTIKMMTAAVMVIWVGFLLYVLRYFKQQAAATAQDLEG